nr:integrase, catalytic region, zinc finger, CCHC-type, peptidase aspartic, catalytic [Tanacetum cinerariifolium]
MANLSEDIQCAGSDTRSPMLDRTDFASWQQRIRLYCQGKENGVNILKSIDKGPFQMGTFRETIAKGKEGAFHLGPERPRVYSDLSPEKNDRYNADIRATNILIQGFPKDIYTLINHCTAKDIWDNVRMLLEDKMLLMQAQETGVALDEEQLLFIAANNYDAFDSDVDEAPTAKTIYMANLSSTDPIYDEAGPSYDSKILSEQVQPALYNGHEIIKTNHVSVIVHNSEDTLEIAEITRKKMNDKIKDSESVKKKVKLAPHDYSKENYLETFTPRKQLTHEQIFWSKDLLKMKVDALKEQTTASRPIKALMVYPPNTPATLVPRVLPTKISRFSDMHDAFNAAQKRIAELESKNSNLQKKIQNDDHDVMVKHFSKLEVEHLNLQLKYQYLKESFENKKSVSSSDAPTFDLVFVIGQLKDQVHSRGNMIHELRDKISRLTKKHSDADPIHDIKALDSQNKELHAKVNALHDLNERCSKHMTWDRSRLRNFVKKFIGTVRFGNDHFSAIMGYGDYVIGDSVISREAFMLCSRYFVQISVEDMLKSSLICLLSKASKNKSWLWHCRLNHLNFGTINDLARKDLVRSLPRLKFEKDHLCSACQLEPPLVKRPVSPATAVPVPVNTAGEEGAFHLGPERPRVYFDLSPEEKDRVDILEVKRIMHGVQVQLVMGELRVENANSDKMLLMQAQENGMALDKEKLLFITDGQDNAVDEDVDEQLVQDLALNVDNVFQADDCDAFNSDVDEALTAQTMFMINLSSVDLVYNEAGPSYDSDILSEVHNHDHYQDAVCEHHEVHEMHDDVQPNYVVDSHANYMSDSNMILYDQYVKDDAVPVVQKDTLEIAEITRKKINDKMKDPMCVKKKVKLAPHDYSKENYLATFTPQKQLTSEQIFWSKDLLKMKVDALKEQTTASRPIKALTVITPTRLTKGERRFEQTKECYLTEVIPFFKTLKDHFEGIKKALTKEMKEIFKELEAEVDQHVVNRKHAKIEQKNILIANDNLIVDCLSKDVFHTATDYVLTISRFSDMHEAFNAAQKRIAELESKNSNQQNKIQNDDHDIIVKHFSKLEVQITENHKSNRVIMPAVKSKVLAPGMYVINVEPITPHNRNNREVHLDYLKHLKESVATLREIVKEARVEKPLDCSLASACRCSKHMIGDFVKKFIRIVRFRNHHFGAIMGYKDYMIGNSVICRVYYVEGLGHNLFSVGQFCDSDLEVTFKKHSCYVRDTDGVELIKGSYSFDLYTVSVEDMLKSSPICLLSKASKNKLWLWHRRLNHLNFGTINGLAKKDLVRGLTQLKFEKDHLCSACQLEPHRVERPVFPALAVPVPVNTTGTPSSTTIDQDATSPSHSPSSSALQSPSLQQSVAAESTIMKDNLLAPVDNDPFVNVFAPEPSSKASSSEDVSSAASTYVTQIHYHLGK